MYKTRLFISDQEVDVSMTTYPLTPGREIRVPEGKRYRVGGVSYTGVMVPIRNLYLSSTIRERPEYEGHASVEQVK